MDHIGDFYRRGVCLPENLGNAAVQTLGHFIEDLSCQEFAAPRRELSAIQPTAASIALFRWNTGQEYARALANQYAERQILSTRGNMTMFLIFGDPQATLHRMQRYLYTASDTMLVQTRNFYVENTCRDHAIRALAFARTRTSAHSSRTLNTEEGHAGVLSSSISLLFLAGLPDRVALFHDDETSLEVLFVRHISRALVCNRRFDRADKGL